MCILRAVSANLGWLLDNFWGIAVFDFLWHVWHILLSDFFKYRCSSVRKVAIVFKLLKVFVFRLPLRHVCPSSTRTAFRLWFKSKKLFDLNFTKVYTYLRLLWCFLGFRSVKPLRYQFPEYLFFIKKAPVTLALVFKVSTFFVEFNNHFSNFGQCWKLYSSIWF